MNQVLDDRNASLQQISQSLPGSLPYDNYRPINIPARLDHQTLLQCVCEMHPHVDQWQWEEWFALGQILRDGLAADPNQLVRAGEQFWHLFPGTVEPAVNPEIRVIWEDDTLVGITKPAPLPVHPCGRFNRNTLSSLLDVVYGPASLRLVHRLDANTTGVMVLARSKASATDLRNQFQNNRVRKRYLVRIHGHPREDHLLCEQPISRQRSTAGVRMIDGKGLDAITEFHVLSRSSDGTSLAEAIPHTGRTNQIRIHLWSLNLPLLGDPSYLPDGRIAATQTLTPSCPAMCLHAWSLSFCHPETNEAITLEAEPPSWAKAVL